MLVEAGADINQATDAGETPLSLSRKYATPEISSLLVGLGARE